MKKIIFACDGKNFSKGAFEFVKWLQTQEPVSISGLFFSSVDYERYMSTSFEPAIDYLQELEEEQQEIAMLSVKKFEEECQLNGIEYTIHDEISTADRDFLIQETRFADLLVISEELFYAQSDASQPNPLMQRILRKAECPVIAVPEAFKKVDNLIAAYNGDLSCMFALKQFAYMFPAWKNMKMNIVYLEKGDDIEMPYFDYLKEYAGKHFYNLNFERLPFESKTRFMEWAAKYPDSLLIAGAFDRSDISLAFKESFARKIIHEHVMPVFITHSN